MTLLVDTGTRNDIDALVSHGTIDGEDMLPGKRDPGFERVPADRKTAHAARE